MSRIYFCSPSGEAEVLGTERYYAGYLINNLALAVLENVIGDRHSHDLPPVVKLMPPQCYVRNNVELKGNSFHFKEEFSVWFRVGGISADTGYLRVGDVHEECLSLGLNTALAIGNDPLKLLARLHGQCEIHTWVDSPNRDWLALIITEGLETGMYRAKAGWEDVVRLLKLRNDEPVVTSFSVTESFPNPELANWPKVWGPDGVHYSYDETWWELPLTQKWNAAMAGLRQQHGLEMKPDDWQSFRFDHKLTAFDVIKAAYEETEHAVA